MNEARESLITLALAHLALSNTKLKIRRKMAENVYKKSKNETVIEEGEIFKIDGKN